jgi:hypothetical protein
VLLNKKQLHDDHTGGGDETMALHKKNQLASLLQEAGALL